MTINHDLIKMEPIRTISPCQIGSSKSKFYTAKEVADLLGVSKSTAYREIKRLNKELKEKGFLIVPGKISKKYFSEKTYF